LGLVLTTIHLVYPHRPLARTPDAIGFNLAKGLRERGYKVLLYNLYNSKQLKFKPSNDDVLLGHPRWETNSTFYDLIKLKGWKRTIVIHPFCPADLESYAHLLKYCAFADRFIAITGKYWTQAISGTHFQEWTGKFLQLDLAIDRKKFPRIKKNFNLPGKRKFIFIGNHTHYKNVNFLNKIAGRIKNIEFHRIGPYSRKFPNLIQHGAHELKSMFAKKLIKDMDFMITMGNRDANPTTVLESSAMGLIALCPIGSGYVESGGVFNISGLNIHEAINDINYFNGIESAFLEQKRKKMTNLLDKYYCWPKFIDEVVREIESDVRFNYKIKMSWNLICIYFVYFISGRKAPWKVKLKNFFRKKKSL